MLVHGCVRECESPCAPAHVHDTLMPNRLIASADAKRRPMQLSGARDSTRVADRPMCSVGQFSTRVNGTVTECPFAHQHTCRKLTDAQRRSIFDTCCQYSPQRCIARKLTSRKSRRRLISNTSELYINTMPLLRNHISCKWTDAQLWSIFDSCRQHNRTIWLHATTNVLQIYRRKASVDLRHLWPVLK